MSLLPTLLALWLSLNYTAIPVLAQDTLTTIATTTTLVIPVYAFAPNFSITATLAAHTTLHTLAAATSTTTATIATTENIQSDLTQHHALDSLVPAVATFSSPPPLSVTTDTPYSPPTATTPKWLPNVSIALLCYDFLAAAGFVWCWAMGHLWWWTRTSTRRGNSSMWGVLVNENLEGELRRLGMV